MENILQTGPSATRVQGLEEIAVVIRQVSVAGNGQLQSTTREDWKKML